MRGIGTVRTNMREHTLTTLTRIQKTPSPLWVNLVALSVYRPLPVTSDNGHAINRMTFRVCANSARTRGAARLGCIAHRKVGPFRDPAIYA